MKKTTLLLFTALLAALPLSAQTTLQQALPLLQQNTRSAEQTQQVLQLFRSSKDPDTVFAAGASLVKIPPAKTLEPALFNLILKSDDPLKQAFSAVIVTAMGSSHEELIPILQETLNGKNDVLRSYAAGAYGIITPADKSYVQDVVLLYIYDPAFAVRAMNLLADDSKALFKYLKQASASTDPQTRAAAASWLGTLHSEDAAKQLLKMAKSEENTNVQAQLATALAANAANTHQPLVKGLRQNYKTAAANTYALALGFMTGNAVEPIRQALASSNQNERINAARAAAYMAGVLSNPDAFHFTSDRTFDIGLLKSLIPQLKVLAQTENDTVKVYAENALRQIEKLMI